VAVLSPISAWLVSELKTTPQFVQLPPEKLRVPEPELCTVPVSDEPESK
jgi:hypothetical protein